MCEALTLNTNSTRAVWNANATKKTYKTYKHMGSMVKCIDVLV